MTPRSNSAPPAEGGSQRDGSMPFSDLRGNDLRGSATHQQGKNLVAEMEAEEMMISANRDRMRKQASGGIGNSNRRSATGGAGGGVSKRRFSMGAKQTSDALSISNDAFLHPEAEERIRQQRITIRQSSRRTMVVALLVILVGAVASASFLYIGITSINRDSEDGFYRQATSVVGEITSAWEDYENTVKWMHESCRNWRTGSLTREDFRVQYEYAVSDGLDFFGVQFVPNVTHYERNQIELEAQSYFMGIPPEREDHQNFTYRGFVGLEPDEESGDDGSMSIQYRSFQQFYFPILLVEPFDAFGLHLDLWSSPYERPTIAKALETGMPTLTPPFRLIGLDEPETVGYTVVLYHPGVIVQGEPPRDLNNVLLRIHALLERAFRGRTESMATFLYDATDATDDNLQFLGASEIRVHDDDTKNITFLDENDAAYENYTFPSLHYQQDVQVGGRTWHVVVFPVDDTFEVNYASIILSGCLIFLASLALAIWMLNNNRRTRQMQKVMANAAAEAAIVSSLFPDTVKARLLEDAEMRAQKRNTPEDKAFHSGDITQEKLTQYLSSEGIFGSKPIAELYPIATLMFADLVGFTAWSSVRDPSQVFTLLEIIYHSFDNIARRRGIFKVETVGDCYVAACGLPEPRPDHAVAMCKFARDCLRRLQKLVKALDTRLGPDTGELDLRVGLNSGPVTAGVLRGLKGRFQLFGDTMNTASRMESTGVKGKIQISEETAELLRQADRGAWLDPRTDEVKVKGKGLMKTYFLQMDTVSMAESDDSGPLVEGIESLHMDCDDDAYKMERLVDWNVELLSDLLRKIVASNKSKNRSTRSLTTQVSSLGGTPGTVLDEFKEIIQLPDYDPDAITNVVDPSSIQLSKDVRQQLHRLITKLGGMYRNNPFHNFSHASHVAMSVSKMGTRIAEFKLDKDKVITNEEAELYHSTFGLANDPLVQFACVFSALIHDLDHPGVPNSTLVKEHAEVAVKYRNQSVAEQNSVDLAWNTFMDSQFEKLRNTICVNQADFKRFRQMVVNIVLATDLMDLELNAARKQRWSKAFGEEGSTKIVEEPANTTIHRKATIVLEHMMQASDVSHTMQHWHIFIKWNERLFHEMYAAYKEGRLEKDPSIGWYQGELGFFDHYIIPLAKKLETCGVFGVSKDEYLNYALVNRKEWEMKGEKMVNQYLTKYKEMEAELRGNVKHSRRSLLFVENSNTDLENSDFEQLLY